MKKVETRILSGAMYELARTIQCDDGIANAACAEAAERLDEQTVEIRRLTCLLDAAESDCDIYVTELAERLPADYVPQIKTWYGLLQSVTQLIKDRRRAMMRVGELKDVISETIEENLHLADGEDCTLIKLKKAINYHDREED